MMNKTVVINFGNGSLHQGCPHITARLWREGHPSAEQFVGRLPAAPEIMDCYAIWQSTYLALCERLVIRSPRAQPMGRTGTGEETEESLEDELEIAESGITQVSQLTFQELSQQLRQTVNRWLHSEGFFNIERQVRSHLTRHEEIRVIFEAENDLLRRLPWHCWDFFRDYPRAEMALSQPEYQRRGISHPSTPRTKVRILAILGNCQNIDVASECQFLEQLPEAEVTFLVMPSRQEFNQQLWQPLGWDILFFAGHSRSEGEIGRIYINENPTNHSLTIEQLENALTRAIDKGLKLAIFNSCDGVGLAQALAKLHIPQVVVMREPVPNRVAQEFLHYFLQAFAIEQLPLYVSVRQARSQLQGLEDDFPGASWLPVIWQNPAETPPTWQTMLERHLPETARSFRVDEAVDLPVSRPVNQPMDRSMDRLVNRARSRLLLSLLTGIVVASLVMAVRSLGWLQTWELWAYDQFVKQSIQAAPDPRLLIVGVNDADMQKYGQTLSDRTVYQLVKKLQRYQPKVIGLDIFRDQPQGEGWQDLTDLLRTNQTIVAICQGLSQRQIPISPPPQVPAKRVGYADTVIHDSDGVIRRYLLAKTMPGISSCSTPYSLVLQLIQHFLPNNSYELRSGLGISVNQKTLEIIQPNSGGHQLASSDTTGYQLLIDYRFSPIARVASLTDILNAKDSDLQAWIRDRIILIGYLSGDEHLTPTGKQPGVVIHAYLVSQVLRTVVDQAPLLSPWPRPIESLWVFVWSAIASWLIWHRSIWNIPPKRVVLIIIGAVLMILVGSSLMLFQQSIWVPVIPAVLAVVVSSCVSVYSRRQI